MNARTRGTGTRAVTLGLLLLPGCAMLPSESASRDAMTAQVGVYPPPPPNVERARVGVPPFQINDQSLHYGDLDAIAADQLTTLAFQTQRFPYAFAPRCLFHSRGPEKIPIGRIVAGKTNNRFILCGNETGHWLIGEAYLGFTGPSCSKVLSDPIDHDGFLCRKGLSNCNPVFS